MFFWTNHNTLVFTFHLHNNKALCNSQNSRAQRQKKVYILNWFYVYLNLHLFGRKFCMLYFLQSSIIWYSNLSKSNTCRATLNVHVEFARAVRAHYIKQYKFPVKSLFAFRLFVSEQITEFTFHLHDNNACSGIRKSLNAGR